jgi:putative peptidoglycan lipid II flippase
LAIPFYSLNKIMISCYYAFQDTKTPLRVQAFTFIFSLVIALSLMESLKHGSIAFASACSSFATSIILFVSIKKHDVHIPLGEIIPRIGKILIPLAFLIIWTYLLNYYFYEELILEFNKHGISYANSSRILLALVLSSGMVGYFVVAYYVGVEECKTIFGKFLK